MAGRDDYAAEMFAELVLAGIERRLPSPFAQEWIASRGLRFVRSNEPLDQVLGLAGRGVDSLPRRLRLIQRDQHLKLAAESVAVSDEVDLWERCKRLARLLQRFEAGKWGQVGVRGLAEPPQAWEAWERHALRAFQVGEGVPLSAEGLYKRLNSNPGFSVCGGSARVLSRFI